MILSENKTFEERKAVCLKALITQPALGQIEPCCCKSHFFENKPRDLKRKK